MSRVRPCRVPPSRTILARRPSGRVFSTSPPIFQQAQGEDSSDPLDDIVEDLVGDGGSAKAESDGDTAQMKYNEWLTTEGRKWRHPDPLGPKWLGGHVPFPLNSTFKPPTPVSDALRTTIYTSFIANPQANDVRALSTRYGVSINRIEAIIRLKELEEQWKKSKPLQTGFLKGMERLLGLNVGGQMTPVAEEVTSVSRRKVAEADDISRQTTKQNRDQKRGVSRTFFELVDEGEEPVVSRLLDEEQLKARAAKTEGRAYPTTIVKPDPSRPGYRFIDVGLRWVDKADMERRAKESVRRKGIKSARKKIAQELARDEVASAVN